MAKAAPEKGPNQGKAAALKGRKNKSARRNQRKQQHWTDVKELEVIEKRLKEETPPKGTNPLADEKVASSSSEMRYSSAKTFDELPITQRTKSGLKSANMVNMTAIQRAAIPHALAGRDVLGAARTGSGKTLAFIIPVLERLARLRWTAMDGLGALIVSPTRELAMQIFSVLKEVGARHSLSAGMIIGGKDYETEAAMLPNMNVLVGTPGRILQHFDETPQFRCDNLVTFVLDEADRCLDMGFSATLNAIVDNLPVSRQTLLFSATQTKSVKTLARLSLKEPQYVAVHESADSATPKKLSQTYMVVDAERKLDVFWSFLKSHLNDKCIVFVSSRKQVRFMFECFRRMHPGVPLFHIHGRMNQHQRMAIYYNFVERNEAVLISTDLAARGLDFPAVNWVLQYDCPDNVDAYIHRAGRTARYRSQGKALLLLLPSELAFVELLAARKVPLRKVKANPAKLVSLSGKLGSFLAQDNELKYLGQKALVSYLRSVFMQKNKTVFDVSAIDAAALSASMGLPGVPKIKFLKTAEAAAASRKKNMPAKLRQLLEKDKKAPEPADDEVAGKVNKLLKRQNQTVYHESRQKLRDEDSDEEDDDGEFMRVTRCDHDLDDVDEQQLKPKHSLSLGKRMSREQLQPETAAMRQGDQLYEQVLKKRIIDADPEDKLVDQQRVHEIHKQQKRFERMQRQKARGVAVGVALAHSESEDVDDSNSEEEKEDSSSGEESASDKQQLDRESEESDEQHDDDDGDELEARALKVLQQRRY